VKVIRRGRHGRFGFGRRGPWGRGGFGAIRARGGFGGPGSFLRGILERLDATPAQERVIASAVEEVQSEAAKSREELRRSRADIASAMRGPSFDEVLFGELFARHDEVIEAMRKSVVGAVGRVHEALDEGQRERLADLIESGRGAFRPFRAAGSMG
jgi:hypothetical protein